LAQFSATMSSFTGMRN